MSPTCCPVPIINNLTEVQVLVCFAVREEARFFKVSACRDTDVLITGIGGQNASEKLSNHLISRRPCLVLTCGFAGGLNPAHALGQLLFRTEEASEFNEQLKKTGALPGRFAHSDRVLVTAQEKKRLYQSTGADAVEMESSIIASICHEQNIPVIVLRVISDTAEEDLPMDFNRYSRADGSLSMPRLLAGIALAPGVIPRLIRFQGRLKRAAASLGDALECFLSSSDLLRNS